MHLEERIRLSHSTKADIITTELTNRNQRKNCGACLNLTQRAHIRKMFWMITARFTMCSFTVHFT